MTLLPRTFTRWLALSLLATLMGCTQLNVSNPSPLVAPAPVAPVASQPDAIALNNQGVQKVQQKNYEGAIQDFSAVIQLQPDLAEAYLGRGIAYSVTEQHQQAINDFTQALALKPAFAEAYLNRADDWMQLAQPSQAIADLQMAAKLFVKQGDTQNADVASERLSALQASSKPPAKPKQIATTDPKPVAAIATKTATPLEAPTQSTSPTESFDASTPVRDPVTGSCDCPYDFASNGSHCGGRSAYSRPGGRDPVCYKGDL